MVFYTSTTEGALAFAFVSVAALASHALAVILAYRVGRNK